MKIFKVGDLVYFVEPRWDMIRSGVIVEIRETRVVIKGSWGVFERPYGYFMKFEQDYIKHD